MLKVGLTGGIGSGKTLVSRVFESLGVPVFNADNESKKIINTDKKIISALKSEFGDEIYTSDGINRQKFAGIIFNDVNALTQVNKIIHPRVREYFLLWAKSKKAVYVIEEAAILFESKANLEMDLTINVHADELLRINRVTQRDNITKQLVLQRIRNQFSDEERINLADFTIFNNENSMIIPQILETHNKILNHI
ncbi:MAG: dephospho-CoA kinase [Bacteroidales bacterium]|nr:dephospho-CoA kinase [Bacteroidales bacterium]